MEIKNGSTALFVRDIEISKKFYTQTLGLKIALDFGKNVIFETGFTIWEISENHIIPQLLETGKWNSPSVHRFELYFETSQIQPVFENLKNKNVCFLHEIHEEPWGQQTIRFFDPDQHLIEIGESLEILVKRLFGGGMSLEAISNKTHIPAAEVNRLIAL